MGLGRAVLRTSDTAPPSNELVGSARPKTRTAGGQTRGIHTDPGRGCRVSKRPSQGQRGEVITPSWGASEPWGAGKAGQGQLDPRPWGSEVTRRRTGRQASRRGPPSPCRASPLQQLKGQEDGPQPPRSPKTRGWRPRKREAAGTPAPRLPPLDAPATTPGRWYYARVVWATAPKGAEEDFEGEGAPCEMHPSPLVPTSCPAPPPPP
ncbi:hypothetical protein GWK47_012779 [Chionoecetes opilio]|uniref:Uncharacterized protein n=1 Tax=Chionoecetes opilio TaxID=41210 RepID=A0A8J4XWL3_CHIOP|nr:hypothetical protein GWK47_012779 [Chionoecetes opilio]